jgi:hypothetical protein
MIANESLRLYDTNKDGKLSAAEVEEMQTLHVKQRVHTMRVASRNILAAVSTQSVAPHMSHRRDQSRRAQSWQRKATSANLHVENALSDANFWFGKPAFLLKLLQYLRSKIAESSAYVIIRP